MFRLKCWFTFVIVCCLVAGFTGCGKKEGPDEGRDGAITTDPVDRSPIAAGMPQPNAPLDPFDMQPAALPTDAELNALGPVHEENRALLQYMPDNPSGFIVMNPARAIQVPYLLKDSNVAELFVSNNFLAEIKPFFPRERQIPFSIIKRMTLCITPVKQKQEINPATGQYPPVSPENARTIVCILELNAPVNDLLLLSLFNIFGDPAVDSLKPVMVNGMKTYEMTPPTQEKPLMERLMFVTPATVVYASGSVSDVTRVFDNAPAQGALPSRILHTDLQNDDMIAMFSSEGVPFGFADMETPYAMGRGAMLQLQDQMGTPEQEQQGMDNFKRVVKHLTMRIDLQTPESEHLLRVNMDFRSPADAEQWKKIMETSVKDLGNAMSLFESRSKQMNILPEQAGTFAENMKMVAFLIAIMDAINVESAGNKIALTFSKVAGFDQNIGEMLAPMFARGRIEMDREALRFLAWGISYYLQQNESRFPQYAIFDANRNPLLSWRVALLPSLGETELYQQFHLNEPWNSEHNSTLIAKMPKCYADPSGQAAAGKTIFRMFGGQGSFAGKFPNGFSNTDLNQGDNRADLTLFLLAVTPEQAVEWTSPEYVQYDSQTFSRMVRQEFAGVFCTGNVEIIPTDHPIIASQLPYWIAGSMSPEVTEAVTREQEALQSNSQFLQMDQSQPPQEGTMPLYDPQIQIPPIGQP